MTDIDVTFGGVSIPGSGSGTLTVYEDVGNDGTGSNSVTLPDGTTFDYDNSDSVSMVNGTTSYTLSGFDASVGNGLKVQVQLDTSNLLATADITEPVEATVGTRTITLPTTTIALDTISPTVVGSGSVDISLSAIELALQTPSISVSADKEFIIYQDADEDLNIGF